MRGTVRACWCRCSDPPGPICPDCFLPEARFAPGFGKYTSLHITSKIKIKISCFSGPDITSKALELGLGLVLANICVRVRVRPVLGTLQASRQIGPRA
jgi:hypothetical protein